MYHRNQSISHRSRINYHLNTTIFGTYVYISVNIERKPLHDTKFINFRQERNIRAPIHTRNHVRLNRIWRRSSIRRTRSRSYLKTSTMCPRSIGMYKIREFIYRWIKEINAFVTFDRIFNIIHNGVYVLIINKLQRCTAFI